MTQRHIRPLAFVLPVLLALACAPPEEGGGPDPLNEEACEHTADGPFNDVTASADGAAAPDISAEHTGHRISTVDVGDDNRGGAVAFESTEETDHTFWLSAHMDLAFTDGSGNEVAIEDSVHEVAECEDVAMFHVVELPVGSYTIDIGPTQEETVTIVWEHGVPGSDGGDHDDMDDMEGM